MARGGDKYELACGDLGAMRVAVCSAFKEANPGDTSSLGYENDCYYEVEADGATTVTSLSLSVLAAISALAF